MSKQKNNKFKRTLGITFILLAILELICIRYFNSLYAILSINFFVVNTVYILYFLKKDDKSRIAIVKLIAVSTWSITYALGILGVVDVSGLLLVLFIVSIILLILLIIKFVENDSDLSKVNPVKTVVMIIFGTQVLFKMMHFPFYSELYLLSILACFLLGGYYLLNSRIKSLS